MDFKELQGYQKELKTHRYTLKRSIHEWLHENDYNSTHVKVDNDKIRVKTYGKPLRGIDLSKIQYEFNMHVTLILETKTENINEDISLYGVKGALFHIWEYWFR